jgi:hypothetical protein
MGVMIERLSFYRELIIMYSLFTMIAGSAFCFVYFLAAQRTPSFWLGVIVFNTLWMLALRSSIKHAYLRGMSDSIRNSPYLRKDIQ